jgi:hypothetical protein
LISAPARLEDYAAVNDIDLVIMKSHDDLVASRRGMAIDDIEAPERSVLTTAKK